MHVLLYILDEELKLDQKPFHQSRRNHESNNNINIIYGSDYNPSSIQPKDQRRLL
jgi:hypothetical protein